MQKLHKKLGPANRMGRVGIAIYACQMFCVLPFQTLVWFCPNKSCHAHSMRTMSALPSILSNFPVQSEINLAMEEICFLPEEGILFGVLTISTRTATVKKMDPSPPS